MNILNHQTETAWLSWRYDPEYARIGASQIASIMGLGFTSPYEEWAKYHGYKPEFDASIEALLRHGHEDEPNLAAWLDAELRRQGTPVYMEDPGPYTVFIHPDNDWAFATPDRIITRQYNPLHEVYEVCKPLPVELKSPKHQPRHEWKVMVPLKYVLQCQWQMYCMGASDCIIAARFTPELYHWLHYDEELIQDIVLPTVRTFREQVMSGTAPMPDGSEGTRSAIQTLYAESEATVIDLPDFEGLADSLDALKAARDEADKRYEAARQRLMDAIGTNQYAQCGDKFYSFKPQKRRGQITVNPEYREALEISGVKFKATEDTAYRVLREVKKLPREAAQIQEG